MRSVLMLSFLLYSMSSWSGDVAYSNMYSSKTFLQGIGANSFEAEADAITAMPAGYVRDRDNSPAIQCTGEGVPQEGRDWACDTRHGPNMVLMTVPIVPKR